MRLSEKGVLFTLAFVVNFVSLTYGDLFSPDQGTFVEGYGVSLYVNPEGQLCTIGNDWDLNDDGRLDLLAINEFEWQGDLQIHDTYSFVFWGSPEGFERTYCDSFPTHGAECAALADFNRDGWTDIVVANSTYPYSYVFYGSQNGYTDSKRDSFLARANHGSISVADLNRDGWFDLVWSSWYVGGNGYSHIYWGSDKGFDMEKTDSLFTGTAHGNIVADFDSDGYADILWAVYYNKYDETRYPSLVYWGEEDGFDPPRKTELPTVGPGDDLSIGDFNNDGILDIVIPNHSSEPPPVWTTYNYSYIYYGQGNRQFGIDSLYAPGPWSSSTADIDDDGWLDVIFACEAYNYPLIYEGSSQGFTRLDTLNSWKPTCVQIADLNNDGKYDIAFGSQASSYLNILYQTEEGWDKHTLTVKAMDAGITKDLGNPYTHKDEAWYISPAIAVVESRDSLAILEDFSIDFETTWQGEGSPQGADVELWVSATLDLESGPWSDWVKFDPQTPTKVAGRSFRYKLCLKTGFRTSVIIKDVTLSFLKDINPLVIQRSESNFEIAVDLDLFGDELIIYDLAGKRVRTLSVNSSGYVCWQGDDNLGNLLPCGVYFIWATQGTSHVSLKVVLLPQKR